MLGQKHFLSPEDITWHEDNWDNQESKYLAFSLHDRCHASFGALVSPYVIMLTGQRPSSMLASEKALVRSCLAACFVSCLP